MDFRFILFVLFTFEICSCSGNSNNTDTSVNSALAKQPNPVYSADYLLGKFNQKTDTMFGAIPIKYCSKEGMYLRKETISAFVKMYEAAKKEGVSLKIISATRNFNEQKSIWDAKWNGSRLVNGKNLSQTIKDPVERARTILRYSSMPGTSRHHWGTDMDLNSLENSYFTTAEGKKVYDWLKNNAVTYGFCQPYSLKSESRPNGYEEEKWHWSYMPLSSVLLKEYSGKIKSESISGFTGSETATKLNIIEHYVKGINPECR